MDFFFVGPVARCLRRGRGVGITAAFVDIGFGVGLDVFLVLFVVADDICVLFVLSPPEPQNLSRQEHWTRTKQDSKIFRAPIKDIRLEAVDDFPEKGMVHTTRHDIVTHSQRRSLGKQSGVFEQRTQFFFTSDVEIEIDPTEVVQDEIPDHVDALYGVGVSSVSWQGPRVIFFEEFLGG